MDIATAAATLSTASTPLDLHISIYVTCKACLKASVNAEPSCVCNSEAVPAIPNSDVIIRARPSIYRVLDKLTSFSSSKSSPRSISWESDEKDDDDDASSDLDIEETAECVSSESGCKVSEIREGGGVAVCASGPASLTRDAANAVARLQMLGKGMRLGGIALHTEVFKL